MSRALPLTAIAAIVLLIGSCASLAYEDSFRRSAGARSEGGSARAASEAAGAGAAPPQPGPVAESAVADTGARQGASRSRASGAGTGQAATLAAATGADAQTGTGPAAEPAGERLRVYRADLEIAVPNTKETRGRVIDLAERLEGYVESSGREHVVIRVPAERFDQAVSEIESYGELRGKAIDATDVTAYVQELERKQQIAEQTRERLYALLEQSENADERVEILREIRRLTEEIERLKAARESVNRLVNFSRITVRLISELAEQEEESRESIPFNWIARLDPLSATVGAAEEPIEIPVGEAFALFSRGERIAAESAEGTRFRAGAAENDPQGDSTFWATALGHHLSPVYRSAEVIERGAYRGYLFESKDRRPFFYLVAVRVRDSEILVAEAFFPNQEARERRLESVLQWLSAADGNEEPGGNS